MYLSSNPRCEKHWSGSGYRQSVPILQTQQHVTVNSEQVGTDEVYLSFKWIWVQVECTYPPITATYNFRVDIRVQAECTYSPTSDG